MGDEPRDPYTRLLLRLEESGAWDHAIGALEPIAGRLVARAALRRLFHGDATGVPLHGLLTDVPFGAWFMAQYLDLFRDDGSRRAATRLMGLGVAAAVPTAIAGWAEWAGADGTTRRVGMTHASLTGLATLVFAASWAARTRERHGLGVGLAGIGSVVVVAGGFLGGHMRSGRRLR